MYTHRISKPETKFGFEKYFIKTVRLTMTRIRGWADTQEGLVVIEDLPQIGGGWIDGQIQYID